MSFYSELKRRNVFRAAIAYLALAWLLTEVAGTLFPVFGIPDWGVRFVVIVLALGFVAALVFSWIYEFTPEGIKREQDVVREASITHLTAKRLDLFTIGLIAVALGFILVDRLWLTPKSGQRPELPSAALNDAAQTSVPDPAEPQHLPNSVAVLPFINMSSDTDQEYFSDGLADSLMNALAQVRDLKVIARTSSFAFKGKNQDIREIGRQLGVGAVLEGSVQKSGNRLRIITQLIHVQDGSHLWAKTFDRTDDDIFAIQDEISAAVVTALQVTLGEDDAHRLARRATGDVQAFDLYLLGRHEFEKRDSTALERAVTHFEQALAQDPDYALAYSGLADSWMLLSQQNYGNLPLREAGDRAKPYLERALALAPDSSAIQASLGLYLDEFRRPGDFPGMTGVSALEKAVQLNPANVLALTWLAIRYQGDGEYRKSFELLKRAYELDPLNTNLLLNMSIWAWNSGDREGAWRYVTRAQELEPGDARHVEWASDLAYYDGELARSLKDILHAQELVPGNIFYMTSVAQACMRLQDFECAAGWIMRAEGVAPGDALVLSMRAELKRREGDLEGAAVLLENALEQSLADVKGWGALDTRYAAVALAEVRLQQDQFVEAVALYEKVFPTLVEALGRNDQFNPVHLLDLAWAYGKLDQPGREQAALAEAGRRLRKAREGGRANWIIDLGESLLSGQSGDVTGAEALLGRAVEDRYPGDWDRINQRLGELLEFSKAYRSALASLEARLAAQRIAAASDLALARARGAMEMWGQSTGIE
jgi:TolB-like protein/Flp pilus assembly protein TadD